jgi:methionyl-tRNA formyltransferase
MKVIFAGTPAFAAQALNGLIEAGFDVALVLTRPDRSAGRGLKERPSAVKEFALANRLALAQPATLKSPSVEEQLRRVEADVMVVAAYGLILPAPVLDMPRRGCLNIHASLLPRWRGAAPIQRALLAGDRETGITIMQMDAGLDTGPMLLQERTDISERDSAQTLHDRLADMGRRCIVRALRESFPAVPQDDGAATYAEKISKAEARIDWNQPAGFIARQIRAFDPAPGASTTLNGKMLKVWRAHAVGGATAVPGQVIEAGDVILVGTGNGAIAIEQIQAAGGKRLSARAFLTGHPLSVGAQLGA